MSFKNVPTFSSKTTLLHKKGNSIVSFLHLNEYKHSSGLSIKNPLNTRRLLEELKTLAQERLTDLPVLHA